MPNRAVFRSGSCLPMTRETHKENTPAPNPFIITIVKGFFSDMCRVRLLSIPQQTHARMMPRVPTETPQSLLKFQDNTMLAKVMRTTAVPTLFPMFSLNTSIAISVVATPSKFSRSEAVEAGVLRRLTMEIIGARIPPNATAPISQGISFTDSAASFSARFVVRRLMSCSKARPIPLPRYRSAAKVTGAVLPNRAFAKGVLIPNKAAARTACSAGYAFAGSSSRAGFADGDFLTALKNTHVVPAPDKPVGFLRVRDAEAVQVGDAVPV